MAGPAYQWGSWRFEPTECRLLRDDELVPLPAKTLDVLSALLRRAPRLVTKEEIFAAVWPDAAVEEGNIAFHVAALRKVLDHDEGPSSIETVRGRGYRFVADVAVGQLVPTAEIQRQMVAEPNRPSSEPEPTGASSPGAAAAPPRRALMGRALVATIVLVAIALLAWSRL